MLLEQLESAGNLPEASSAGKALGLIGDQRASAKLLAIARNKKEQIFRRAFALVALGILAEKTPVPWNTPYAIDNNYTLDVRSLNQVLAIN